MNKKHLNTILRGILLGCIVWFSAYIFFRGDIPFYGLLGAICGLLGMLFGIIKRSRFNDDTDQ
jgi:hypothetical protein